MAKSESTEAGAPAKPRFETLRAILWAALIALAIRSFVVEPFKIPSGSMIPTLLVGDYVLVNKFSYGVRLPITGTLLFGERPPSRGDVVVFRWPDDPSQDYIKRVIGLPGDRIQIIDRRLWLNGQLVDRIDEGAYAMPSDGSSSPGSAARYRERNPEGLEYTVLQAPGQIAGPADRRGPWLVPEGHYFMMGDNRDNSRDSRLWDHPFVSPEQIKGRAFLIHWSWVVASAEQAPRSFIGDLFFTLWRVVTFQVEEIRWGRIGSKVGGPAD
ncbi:MAG: signal peptidase I [Deltaproteobacteria bacterium]|nr:signal peptidase I [Deltaproteobacteria bacterium]